MDKDIILGAIYKYKKGSYRALKFVQMKNPVTREWQRAIMYVPMGYAAHLINVNYVRCAKEFLEKFVRVSK